MSASTNRHRAASGLNLSGDAARHGVQLAVAVTLAYGLSAAIGLPEGFWAVMSALIVVRPNTGATFGAGWDRIRGTLMGTACGLAGVGLRHAGLGLPVATLAIVALLAFGSAVVPALRSAPISALIVVSSSGMAGHSPFAVAGLRAAEICVGVAAGLAVTMLIPASRASADFDRSAAALLRQIAEQVRRSMTRAEARGTDLRAAESAESDQSSQTKEAAGAAVDTGPFAEAAGAALRAELRRLAILAEDADRETRLFRRRKPAQSDGASSPAGRYRKTARVLARVAQDAGSLGRMFDALPHRQHEPLWESVSAASFEALVGSAAAMLDPSAPSRLGALARAGESLSHPPLGTPLVAEPAALLTGPITLLLRDLRLLRRLASHTDPQSPPG